MISSVYIWTNGMVTVFDKDGHQLVNLQGRFGEMAKKISENLHKRGEDEGVMTVEIYMAKWRAEKILLPNLESFDRLWKRSGE